VRQAVGRIRRTGAAAAADVTPQALDAAPLLGQRVALVIDLVDTFGPFARWAETRRTYYRSEHFHVSEARVILNEPWWTPPQNGK
jgi:hypothetical protein